MATWTSRLQGTVDGVTGMQMDVKVDGLTIEILAKGVRADAESAHRDFEGAHGDAA